MFALTHKDCPNTSRPAGMDANARHPDGDLRLKQRETGGVTRVEGRHDHPFAVVFPRIPLHAGRRFPQTLSDPIRGSHPDFTVADNSAQL